MESLLAISIALAAGLFMTRIIKPLKLPAVTAYLIAGILIGPYCLGRLGIDGLGFISNENVSQFELFSDVALGFIAFAIGNEFRLTQLKNMGKKATVIGILQALAAAALVDIVLLLLHLVLGDRLPIPVCIVLGAIATATAPAATLMVVRQYKAKGPMTSLLLSVVAIDDAVGLVVFSVSFGIAKAMTFGVTDIKAIILEPIIEVTLSLAFGAVAGAILTFCEKFFKSNSKRLCLSVTFVLLTVAISMLEFKIGSVHVAFSPLLVCMMLGTIFCNLCDFSEELMEKADKWTVPLFVFFFVVSGASLDFSVFKSPYVIGIGIIFIVVRSIGKYVGTYASAALVGCDKKVKQNLGITLLPQAGVALGMCIEAQALGNDDAVMIKNIILFAVLIYELVGPFLTKVALTRAGEIVPKQVAEKV